jgi:hypothetical protein
MKIHLRVDSSNAAHTKFTVFMEGGNCGQLTARTEDFFNFYQLILRGSRDGIDEFHGSGKPYVATDPEEVDSGEPVKAGEGGSSEQESNSAG